jgi:hypothetical protein
LLALGGGGTTYENPLARAPLCLLAFVTTTFTVPAACAGALAVISLLLTTITCVAAVPPKLTVAPLAKSTPLITTAVPPLMDPEAGLTLAILGPGALYVKPVARVPLSLLGFVTTTFTAPLACAGVVATIDVLLATMTAVAAGTPPKLTVAPFAKFFPVIVTVVPPFVVPELGTTLLTVGDGGGGGGATYVKAFARVALWLLGLVTTTVTAPAACAGALAVMVVLLTTVTVVAAVPPKLTVAPLAKFAPEIVIVPPPSVDPEFGVTVFTETDGATPTANVVESIAAGLSALSTILDAFRAHTVIR